jgi:hypothetical protein
MDKGLRFAWFLPVVALVSVSWTRTTAVDMVEILKWISLDTVKMNFEEGGGPHTPT